MACLFCVLVGCFFGSVKFWNGNNEQNTTISCIAQIQYSYVRKCVVP